MNEKDPSPVIAQFFGSLNQVDLRKVPSTQDYIKSALGAGSNLMKWGFHLPSWNSGVSFKPFESTHVNNKETVVVASSPGVQKKGPNKPTDVSTVTARIMSSNSTGSTLVDQQYSRNVHLLANGRRPEAEAYAKSISDTYKRMSEIPPLVMLVNPTRFVTSYEQSSDIIAARRSHIVSNWLEKPVVITGEGSTLGFFAYPSHAIGRSSGGGISHNDRIYSLAYANFMSLLALYLDNANFQPIVNATAASSGIPVGIGNVYLSYDDKYYLGSFDTMTVSDSADQPFTLSYTFTFHARYILRSK